MTLGIRTWVSHSASQIASRRAKRVAPFHPTRCKKRLGVRLAHGVTHARARALLLTLPPVRARA